MTSVDLSVFDLLRVDHRRVWAPSSTNYESWVAAGKPCLRYNCARRHGNHIPSEDMECSECGCLGFGGFAHSDDSIATRAIRSPKRRHKCADAQLAVSCPTDPNPIRSPLPGKGPGHERHAC